MTKTRSVSLSRKGQIVIPKEVRQALGVAEGGELLMTLDGDSVTLTRPQRHIRASRGILRGTWGRTKAEVLRYLDKERAAWE